MKRIEKKVYGKNGELISFSSRPHPIDKYWSRIKIYFKKNHMDMCACYWCLKERFTSNTTCPKCKKRKLKMVGWHKNYGPGRPHESGTHYHCKCGFIKK